MGATVALPFLDAMVPAGRSTRGRRPTADKTRLICIEEVHGLAGCNNWGAIKFLFAPETTGRDFTLVPDNPLSTLDAFRDADDDRQQHRRAQRRGVRAAGNRRRSLPLERGVPDPVAPEADAGLGPVRRHLARSALRQARRPDHAAAVDAVLHREPRSGGRLHLQLLVRLHRLDQLGVAERAAADDPRSARSPSTCCSASGNTPEERAARRETRSSILDWIGGEVERVRRSLGTGDRQRLDKYMDNVREIERRIQAVEAHNRSGEARALPDAPAGVPDSFSEHMKLLFDLQVLALQTDMTRVISFKIGRDAQNRVFPESGSNQPFHPASHHGNREDRIMEFNKICKYRVGQVAYLLDKMKTTMDGDGSLLDKSMVIWGSPMADPNIHNHRRCPLALFGHANGALKGGVHLKAEDGTPMANVMLAAMHKLGLDDIKTFGDSTGVFAL